MFVVFRVRGVPCSWRWENMYVVSSPKYSNTLEPKLRHRDIQERRVDNIGEWLLQTEEFRNWHDSHDGSGEGEGGKAVLFGYGGPGVGKTFIR